MISPDAPRGHWIAGRWRGDESRVVPRFGWSWVLGVLGMVVLLDLVLGLLPAPPASSTPTRVELRAAIRAAADAPGRTLLVLGDRRLDAATLREQLDRDSTLTLHAIDLPELNPSDALALVRELDRVDPDASVELALTIDLRDLEPPRRRSTARSPRPVRWSVTSPVRRSG